MGDRIQIQFIDAGGNLSSALYAHWRGEDLLKDAKDFIKHINKTYEKGKKKGINAYNDPLYRRDAGIVLFNFIAWIQRRRLIEHIADSADDEGAEWRKINAYFARHGLTTSSYSLLDEAGDGRWCDNGAWLVDTRDGSADYVEPDSEEAEREEAIPA